MPEIAAQLSPLRKANKAEAAEFFDVAVQTIDGWLRRGAPLVQRGRQGLPWVLDLRALAKWKYGATEESDRVNPDDMLPKERLDHYRAEREKTKHEEDVGLLVKAFDVEQAMAATYKALVQAIETFPDRMEQEQGATPEEVSRLQALGDRLRGLLHEAAI